MANYAYLELTKPIDAHELSQILVQAKDKALGPAWRCRLFPEDDSQVTWFIHLPNTAIFSMDEANARCLAPGQDVGFIISVPEENLATTISFRHGPNRFENWAQGCMEEELAECFGVGVLYDATNETRPPGSRIYRAGSYKDYCLKGFDKPISAADEKFVADRFKDMAPIGFW